MHCFVGIGKTKDGEKMWYDFTKLKEHGYYPMKVMWNTEPELVKDDIDQCLGKSNKWIEYKDYGDKFIPTLPENITQIIKKHLIWKKD
jgi:hypothetical protein